MKQTAESQRQQRPSSEHAAGVRNRPEHNLIKVQTWEEENLSAEWIIINRSAFSIEQ